MPYKYKLNEMSKKASAEDAEKELGIPKSKFEVGQVTVSSDGTSQSTITNIDPDTGAISWKIKQLPGFEKLYDEVDEFVDVAKRVYQKTKDDKKFREFYEQARKIRNAIRTHLRNEYPDQYKRIVNISEINENEEKGNRVPEASLILPRGEEVILQAEEQDYKRGLKVTLMGDGGYKVKYWYGDDIKTYPAEVEVDGESIKKDAKEVDILFHPELGEMSTSGGAGAYQTPYAFRLKKQKPNIKAYKELGYKEVKEAEYRGVEFEDYIDELEKTMYVDRRDRGRFFIHPLDKPDVRRPSNDYIAIDGNNVIAVQGYNSGPISVLADRYGLDDEDSRMTPMGKTNAEGRVSLLSSNILKDAIKAIEDSRDVEAKKQQDYYRERGPVSGVGSMDEEYIVTGKKGKGESQYGKPYGTKKEAEAAMEKILKSIKDAGEKPDAKFGVRKGPLEENNNPGATLGPGPKAGPTGVKDNYYVKAFKYKLVPDKIKGSGIEVKKLF